MALLESKRAGGFIVSCDHCRKEEIISARDFYIAKEKVKDNKNWILKKIDGYWNNFCSEYCHQDFLGG